MKPENIKIIEDFLRGTPIWIDSMKIHDSISGLKCCIYCGVDPEKMAALVEAIKELRKKANV